MSFYLVLHDPFIFEIPIGLEWGSMHKPFQLQHLFNIILFSFCSLQTVSADAKSGKKKEKDKTDKDRRGGSKQPATPKSKETKDGAKGESMQPAPPPASDDDEDDGDENGYDAPDTSGDAALAASLSDVRGSTRNRDLKRGKGRKAAALAEMRKVCLRRID